MASNLESSPAESLSSIAALSLSNVPPPPPPPPPVVDGSNVPSLSNTVPLSFAEMVDAHPGSSGGSNLTPDEIAELIHPVVPRLQWGNYFSYVSRRIFEVDDQNATLELATVLLLRDVGPHKLGEEVAAVTIDVDAGKLLIDGDDEWWVL